MQDRERKVILSHGIYKVEFNLSENVTLKLSRTYYQPGTNHHLRTRSSGLKCFISLHCSPGIHSYEWSPEDLSHLSSLSDARCQWYSLELAHFFETGEIKSILMRSPSHVPSSRFSRMIRLTFSMILGSCIISLFENSEGSRFWKFEWRLNRITIRWWGSRRRESY